MISGEPMVLAMLAALRPVTDTMSPAPMAARSMRPSPERFHSFVKRPSSTSSPADNQCMDTVTRCESRTMSTVSDMHLRPPPSSWRRCQRRKPRSEEAHFLYNPYSHFETCGGEPFRGAQTQNPLSISGRKGTRGTTCMMQHSDAVPDLGLARCNSAGGNSAQEAVVLHHGHQHGKGVGSAVCWRRYVPDNGVQQRLHRRMLWLAARLGQHNVCPALQHAVPGPARTSQRLSRFKARP